MQALDITADQIESAVMRFGTNTGGGFVDQHGREYLIRNVGLTKRLEDLGNTVVVSRNGQPILLKQIAAVEFAARVKRGDAGYRGRPAVVVSIHSNPMPIPSASPAPSRPPCMTFSAPFLRYFSDQHSRQATFTKPDLQRGTGRFEAACGRRHRPVPVSDECGFSGPRRDPNSILVSMLVFRAFG
jgi:hypothetical protein